MGRKKIFSSVRAGQELLEAMAMAIHNITEELKKPVDKDLNGSARRSELKSIKESAIDAKELITEYQKLETMLKELKETGTFIINDRSPLFTIYLSLFSWMNFPTNLIFQHIASSILLTFSFLLLLLVILTQYNYVTNLFKKRSPQL